MLNQSLGLEEWNSGRMDVVYRYKSGFGLGGEFRANCASLAMAFTSLVPWRLSTVVNTTTQLVRPRQLLKLETRGVMGMGVELLLSEASWICYARE